MVNFTRFSSSTTLGAPGASDVFVTAASDIAGMNSSQIANRLTIPSSSLGFNVIEFNTPAIGLSSPINRTNPGFVGFGRTAGGAREFTILKQNIKNFLQKLNIISSPAKGLWGQWRTNPQDITTIKQYGSTLITFNKDKSMFYDIETEGRVQRIIMTYEVIGEYLQTDQPSSPRKEMTKFKFQNGKLELYFEGIKSSYIPTGR